MAKPFWISTAKFVGPIPNQNHKRFGIAQDEAPLVFAQWE